MAVRQWLYQWHRNGVELILYGSNLRFLLPWLWLKLSYLLDSPYSVSRRYERKRKASDLYVYGETPLRTLELITERTGLTSKDHVFELGSGSGFTALWLHGIKKCRVTAVEQVPLFCWRLHRTIKRMGLPAVSVRCESYLQTPLQGATVIYLYGSNLEDAVITELTERLAELPKGVRLITISFPLTDFAKNHDFIIKDQLKAQFEWGEADVFIQERC
ncbi:MAG: SAM-dependent methyltransferase [Endozoicomonas sp.]